MTTRIEASRLIPGQGEVIDNSVVVIGEDANSYAGSAGDAPDTPGSLLRRSCAGWPTEPAHDDWRVGVSEVPTTHGSQQS